MSKAKAKKRLVIVESPVKARTISRFLKSGTAASGGGYIVESCMGHIRDLPESAKEVPEQYKKKPWSSLAVDVENDFRPIYLVPASKAKVVKRLKSRLKEADELLLAADEDREGESICRHLTEILKPKVPVKRMVFHEITKEAVEESLKNFRKVDGDLTAAQEARRVLDRLVGYTISPLLWKKISPGLSAGRVQSAAVKLISERELERIRFVKADYWSLQAEFSVKRQSFQAGLQSVRSKRIAKAKDFDDKGRLKSGPKAPVLHLQEAAAKQLKEKLKGKSFTVRSIETKPLSRSPKPPFTTSALQQAGARILNFSARRTMQVAQKLYEKGFITYMRTDSTALSQSALKDIRQIIARDCGKNYLPEKPRFYRTKTKSAQEAHEAIRPAGHIKRPSQTGLQGEEAALYDLIWRQAVASQMKNAELKQSSVSLSCEDTVWSASGTVVAFPGFYKIMKPEEDGGSGLLPKMKAGDRLKPQKTEASGHETQPPARYNEASLIQTLEREGIGRPSTYSPIISAIQDRGYARKSGKALGPTWTALAVTEFLDACFPDYVNLKFTSRMEDVLDEIATGKADSKKYLSRVYKGKQGLKNQAETQEKQIDPKKFRRLSIRPFGPDISIHVGRYGAYITQKKKGEERKANLPADVFPADLAKEEPEKLLNFERPKEELFGLHPETKERILLKTGRYGPYLSMEKTKKTASIPGFAPLESLSLKQAVWLLELPKTIGKHPKTGKEVKKSIGRYGPYIVHDGNFRSLAADQSFWTVSLKEAVKILALPKKKAQRAAVKKWNHKGDLIQVLSGRYGPYLRFQGKNIALPKNLSPETLSLEEALAVCQGAANRKSGKGKTPAKKKASGKPKAPAKSKAAGRKSGGRNQPGGKSAKPRSGQKTGKK